MALNGQDMRLFLSVDGALNDPQPDPNDSLGGTKSSTAVQDAESTVTTAGTVFSFIDSTQTGASLVGVWALFVTGAAAMQARKIVFHDTGTGELGFAPGFDNAPGVGDVYRLFGVTSLFDAISPAQAAAGATDYRLVIFDNNTGEQLTDVRAYLEPLEPGLTDLRIAMGNQNQVTPAIDVIADEETEPSLASTTGLGTTRQYWRSPRSFGAANNSTPKDTAPPHAITNGRRAGVWLERTVRPLSRQLSGGAWLLVVESLSATPSGGGPYRTGAVIAFDVQGFTPALAVAFDRVPRTFGGARMAATIVDADLGFPIEGERVRASLVAPSPGSLEGEGDLVTDEAGGATFVYRAPDDEAEVGSSVEVEVEIGGF